MSMTASTPAPADTRLPPVGLIGPLPGVTTGMQDDQGEGENRRGGYLTGVDMTLGGTGDTIRLKSKKKR